MKVALIQCPSWWTVDPPVGLAQIAGCVKAAGHEPLVWDLNILLARNASKGYESMWRWEQFHFWNDPETVRRFFADNEALIDGYLSKIAASGASVAGFSVYHGSHLASLEAARRLKMKNPELRIVFGGQYFRFGDAKERMMRESAVDEVIVGAGDAAFPELLARLEKTGECAGPGERAVKNLSAVPFADYDGFPLELYDEPRRLPMQGSRGCVWRCHFCSSWPFWKGYTHMDGERLFAELMRHKEAHPKVTHFEFYDITANGDPKALERLCDLIIEDKTKNGDAHFFGWKINAIIRPEMTKELLAKLYAANCRDIIYGIESGSPSVLKKMNKGFEIEVAERVLADTHAAGIRAVGNFMFGFPGETEEDFEQTLEFVRRNSASLDRVYASATFTSLEENSVLADKRAQFGIREERPGEFHHLYWESEDGTNTYLVRQERYRRFRKLAIELGIDAYRGVIGSVEQDRLANLAQYYRYRGDHVKAVESLIDYLERDFYNEPMRRELERYASDLSRLERAARRMARATRKTGEERLRREERAREAAAAMRDFAAYSRRGGYWVWGVSEGLDELGVRMLSNRAQRMIRLAETEIKSGVSELPVPACAR